MTAGGEVVQVTGIIIMIEIVIERGIVIKIVKDHMSGMVEVGMEEGAWIGGSGMEEMKAGIGTATGVGHVPLQGILTGGHLEVQSNHISGLCC